MIGCFVSAGIMGLIALILLLCSGIVSSAEKNFVKNKRQGKAKVIGYEQDEGSAGSNLSVQLLDINDRKSYKKNCVSCVPRLRSFFLREDHSSIFSTLMILVFPLFPSIIPPVRTTLSPDLRPRTLVASRMELANMDSMES